MFRILICRSEQKDFTTHKIVSCNEEVDREIELLKKEGNILILVEEE